MRISDWSSDVCSSDLSPPDRMGQRPSAVEYSPPDDPCTDTDQATHEIGRRRVVRHEEATDDIAADRSGARHRAVDRGDLALIGGRARSEARRVGKTCVSPGRSRLSTYTKKKTKK